VAGGELDVSQWHPGIEGGHDEPGPQHVRMHRTKSGTPANRADPPVSGAPVEPLTVLAAQDRPFVTFPDGEVEGAGVRGTSGMTAGLLPLPTIDSVRWPRWTARSSILGHLLRRRAGFTQRGLTVEGEQLSSGGQGRPVGSYRLNIRGQSGRCSERHDGSMEQAPTGQSLRASGSSRGIDVRTIGHGSEPSESGPSVRGWRGE
jgi:hypothetical protein